MADHPIAIIGAGPAGLTAAYLLTKRGAPVVVLESDPTYVGGISRTAQYKGYSFDIGGHRFFSKSLEVENLWTELLPDMLQRPRSSRIYYNGQFFTYPLKGFEALRKLGVIEAARCVLSYAKARAFPKKNPANFQEWVSNEFGERLFGIFFETYTEKVWGMSCTEISADWAAQRIKGLSLGKAIVGALTASKQSKKQDRREVVKTLVDTFRYPRKGPGMLWEACAAKVRAQGGEVRMGQRVTGLAFDEARGLWTLTVESAGGASTLTAHHVISSAPLRELTLGIDPPVSEAARAAAASLRYRDFLTVMLVLKDRNLFDDNWIYIHDPSVRVGRIQNFKSWSPEMVPDPAMCCYGLEYFCFEGDGVWTSSDEQLIALARRELEAIGLARAEDVLDGCVVRQKKAYPVYDDGYAERVASIREELERRFPTLHVVGRNGMHKYNNQDHAMMTAMLTVENIVSGRRAFDVWRVNEDAEYHESGEAGASSVSGLRQVPTRNGSAA